MAGCGEQEVGEGAAVSVYVSGPLSGEGAAAGRALCEGVRRRLAAAGGRADGFAVGVVCLDSSGADGRSALAAVGANARRAAEDSAAVAYLGEPDPAAARFSEPILATAGIAQLAGTSDGERLMGMTLAAIRGADRSEGLREAVEEELFP